MVSRCASVPLSPPMDLCILSMYSMAATPRTLLVVDDDPSIHELIGAMLAGKGWELDRADNGEDALARLAAHSYDLVLSDILMPGMDGLTLLGHIDRKSTRLNSSHLVI